jgi:hypothetical protein
MEAETGTECGSVSTMIKFRKITVQVPAKLLEKAQQASRAGTTQTVHLGLQLVAATNAYARLRQFRGKVQFSQRFAALKSDRRD